MNEHLKDFLSSGKLVPQIIKTALSKDEKKADYLYSVTACDCWTNTPAQSVPIYRVYDHVHAFLDECKISEGKAVSPKGKVRKVLFLGYDGMRADMAAMLVTQRNAYDKNIASVGTRYGGISTVAKDGGLYLAYCGGEAACANQQSTSTSAGWTAQLTGVWGTKNGIKENHHSKNLNCKTFVLEYAEKGLATSINFDWTPFFDDNLKHEIEYAIAHPKLKIIFANTSLTDYDKKSDVQKRTCCAKKVGRTVGDTAARDYTLYRMEQGDTVVCGIYDSIDGAGHKYGFSPECSEYISAASTCDGYTYQILQEVRRREEEYGEEWLVILANDHGGTGKGHGGQSPEERTTWIATNRPISTDFYGKGYNGKTEKH